ncbi:VOC family protein [Streptacidiphilus griseoplanus]|uniref:VOC family protein n=1 Tax=Peterkaempfera griseoplana TaxID=66896 RepID=UPI0006E26620|nr:VOC family protein [Peterkaempfera griseoplana]
MAVRDIAYAELYTRDKVASVDHLVSSLGFTRVADSVAADRSSVLLRQNDVQLVVTSGRGIWRFLDEHGDGIAVLAMTCDDVPDSVAAAEAAGARLLGSEYGSPVVSGFGGVTHTLLPHTRNPAAELPAGRRWHATPGAPERPGGRIRSLDHLEICLDGGGLTDYAGLCRDGFGFTRLSSAREEFGEQAMDSVVMCGSSPRATLSLVAPAPDREPGQLDAFLDRNGGPGVQRLAFLVDDLPAAAHEFRDRGLEVLTVPDAGDGTRPEGRTAPTEDPAAPGGVGIPVDHDGSGSLLRLLSRSPYERNTLSFELVQRRGARGLGSAGTRALYEAVERDRLAAG